MGILDRLDEIQKASKIETKMLGDKFEEDRLCVETSIPAVNLMLSGKYHGGFHGGLTMVAAPSRHFKSGLMLLAMKAYLQKFPEGLVLFYDSENGAAKSMFSAYGFSKDDMKRILWVEIANLEELQHHMIPLLTKHIEKGDRVFIGIDSVGNLASIKEVTDMGDGKSTVDMTRARNFKSFWRAAVPLLNRFEIPCFAVGHVYKTMEMFSQTIMSGGTGGMLSADSVIFLTKSTNKDGKEIEGFNFTMVAEKSRFVRERSKIPLTISFEDGIDPASGLLDLGIFTETIKREGIKYYRQFSDPETGEVEEDKDSRKRKHIDKKWFDEFIDDPKWDFKARAESYFQLSETRLLSSDEEDSVIDGIYDDEKDDENDRHQTEG